MIASSIIAAAIPQLHASTTANLAGWTEADLYAYLNRSLSEACADSALLGDYNSVAVAANQLLAVIPGNFLSCIQAQWDKKTLKIRSASEMDALDTYWQTATSGTPHTIVVDLQGQNNVRLYPMPAIAGTLYVWTRQRPALQSSVSSIAVPQAVAWVVEMETIAEANRKGGQFAMPEAAAAAQSVADVLKVALRTYYGGAV